MRKPLVIWAVTEGRPGVENQALGLAEAVARIGGGDVVAKRFSVKTPWRSVPRALWGDPFRRLAPSGALLRRPWPDVWIGAGRLSIPFTMAVGRREPRVFTVQVQAPRAPLSAFDLIVPPRHDEMVGGNVLAILGSPNRMTTERLADDGRRLAEALSHLPRPRVAALIGGASRAHRLSPARAKEIGGALARLSREGAGVMVTMSPRTGRENARIIAAELAETDAWVWNGEPFAGLSNPYSGMLGLADNILVTEDSTNMTTEAAVTGTPVQLIKMDGGAPKFERFKAQLIAAGVARPFKGDLETWDYTPLRETERAAEEILRRLDAKRAG